MSEPIRHTQTDWDKFFYAIAERSAMMSKDPNRKVGAALASADRRRISMGYNGFPPEVPDTPENLCCREFRLANMVHAEDNCLRQVPFDPQGSSLYVTRFPCLECTHKIIQSKVARVIAPMYDPSHHKWGPSWTASAYELTLANIALVFIEDWRKQDETAPSRIC